MTLMRHDGDSRWLLGCAVRCWAVAGLRWTARGSGWLMGGGWAGRLLGCTGMILGGRQSCSTARLAVDAAELREGY